MSPDTDRSHPATLDEWLHYIDRVHPQAIAMGLERVTKVKDALRLDPRFPIITVGGTNGKGSVCAMLEAILHHAGYRVGCYTSPHLVRYNERVRIARHEADDAALVRAFTAVEQARSTLSEPVTLTYFEFGTLAAMGLYVEAKIDVAILEVGLGGRLDAVNAFDADCAVVTSIALDHMDYLGDTREKIGYEKAGIFRSGRPAICGDSDPPESLRRHASEVAAKLQVRGADFDYTAGPVQWRYRGLGGTKHSLPHPVLRGAHQLANASTCIAALDAMRDRLPVSMNNIRAGLLDAETPGRFQVLPGRPAVILDVAHNPAAATALALTLDAMGCGGRTYAVFAMLRDKDIAGVIASIAARVDRWFVAGIDSPRGASADHLVKILSDSEVRGAITSCANIADAYAEACDSASQNDRILVFGSFYTVAQAMEARAIRRAS